MHAVHGCGCKKKRKKKKKCGCEMKDTPSPILTSLVSEPKQ